MTGMGINENAGAARRRRSIRLRGYDYSGEGAYFVTICTQNRDLLFGDMADGEMRLNEAGEMVRMVWDEIPARYPGIDIDEFVIMPNHIHGIIVIVGAGPRACPDLEETKPAGKPQGEPPVLSLPDVVHRFKTMTTKGYADGVKEKGWTPFPGRLWQRNYWEHIVRNEPELNNIREYIHGNPARWESDKLFAKGQARGLLGQAQGPAPTANCRIESWEN